MNPSTEDNPASAEMTPIIAASLNYLSKQVAKLNHLPTPIFVYEQHNQILYAVKMGLQRPETWRAAVELTLATFLAAYGSGAWAEWPPVYERINAAAVRRSFRPIFGRLCGGVLF